MNAYAMEYTKNGKLMYGFAFSRKRAVTLAHSVGVDTLYFKRVRSRRDIIGYDWPTFVSGAYPCHVTYLMRKVRVRPWNVKVGDYIEEYGRRERVTRIDIRVNHFTRERFWTFTTRETCESHKTYAYSTAMGHPVRVTVWR